MTEYVVLILGDADRWWSSMSLQERKDGYEQYDKFSAALMAGGHKIVGGAELHATSEAKTVHPGGTMITDGPFAESAEQVGGFYQIETDDLDGLLECCTIITALGDAIEVRRTVSPAERPS